VRWSSVLVLTALGCLAQDLESIKAERDPERRSERALDAAERTLSVSRDNYAEGDYKKAMAGVNEIREAVDLARDSLVDSHKNPHKSKYFKRAELRLRELARHLEEFKRESSVDDRPPIDALIAHVNEIHDELLVGILEKKK
jgi:hypothetical protein